MMKNQTVKKIVTFVLSAMFSFSTLSMPVVALAQNANLPANTNDPFGIQYGKKTGLGEKDPRETVASVIKIIMGFLGTVAIVIILLGGFKWMIASGNDEKVSEAKKLIASGIIGLVIILSAYAITTFVLNQLINATGAGTTTP